MKNQFKTRIAVWIFVISLASSIWLSFQYYNNYKKIIEKNTIQLTQSNINFILKTMDSKLSAVEIYANSILSNEEFYSILEEPYVETPDNGLRVVDLQDKMRLQMYRTLVQDYISRVLIYGNNGVTMQWSNSFGSIDDEKEVKERPFFKESMANPHFSWVGIADGIISNNLYAQKVLPIIRPFYAYSAVDSVGYLYIEISGSLLGDIIKEYQAAPGTDIFIFNQQGSYITHNQDELVGQKIPFFEEIQPFLQENGGNKVIRQDGVDKLFVYSRSEYTGWVIAQVIPIKNLNMENRTFLIFSLQIVLSGIIFVILISILVSKTLTRPISRIVQHVERIQKGDFSVNPDIESDDEIGQIGKVINGMAIGISNLVEENTKREEAKKELELEVLQTQINPHFLYNTLNSIKWMATIQKNDSIVDMVVSLSRLLRNIAKGVSGKTTLGEEVSLLKEYINIQKLRYGEKFEVYFDEEMEHFNSCLIVKFILQPLVENAIFHGIEPKEGTGNIFITTYCDGPDLQIIVEDDGIGMSLAETSQVKEESKGRFSKIGLRNIEERIKLAYGEAYGLQVESEPGQFTRVIITIPKEYGEEELQ